MTTNRIGVVLLSGVVLLCSGCAAFGPGGVVRLDRIELPPGFSIDFYARDVPDARSLALSPSGVVYVGSRQAGRVYALLDTNSDNRADRVVTIARGLKQPNGVTFADGALYVAEDYRVIRFDDIEHHLDDPPRPVLLTDSFPPGGEHSWKYLRMGPDSLLYISVGSPFNAGIPDDDRYATIMRMNRDGSGLAVYASGVRNTMGFDWHPETQEMWFTDNGRDWLGENQPPDELNRAPISGLDFGWPYCYGKNVPDPEFGKDADPSAYTPTELDIQAHSATLGMRFYTGIMFPAEYRNQIFIAEHGSWNRIVPTGYQVVVARLRGNETIGSEVFAKGWLRGVTAWGRPVDVLVMPDGALLVSDDKAGCVYRISYRP